MDRPARTLLEQLIRRSNRTYEETCADYEATGITMGERGASLSLRQLNRWIAGELGEARPMAKRIAEKHWGYPFAQLVGPPARDVTEPVTDQVQPWAPTPDDLVEAAAHMAANESSQHAASHGGGVDSASIEQAHESAARLARRYHQMSPARLLVEARQARDAAYQLLDRTRKPSQTRDLYLAAGYACGLMSLASFDLAVWEAAEEQARAARTYAELADDKALAAWALGTQALIAFWAGSPRRAVHLAQMGADTAPVGKQQARLRGIEARAWAYLGSEPGVSQALRQADQAMELARNDDPIMDEIGGEFGWGPSLHAACAGTALVVLGDGHHAAIRVREAIAAIPHDPSSGLVPERAQIDLANAELLAGRLDPAQEALAPIWNLPVPFRRVTSMDVVYR